MLWRRPVLAAVLIGLLGTACAGVGTPAGRSRSTPATIPPIPAPAGEVTVAYPEEPASLNPYLFEGDSNATRDLLRPVLPTLLSIRPNLGYGPGLATKVPSGADLSREPFSVTFNLDPRALWSDGRPITASDVRFTWEIIKDPRWPIADRTGYMRLTDVAEVDPLTVRLVFDGPYGPWRNLFSGGDFILPRHFLEGKDFSNEFKDAIPVSGGPFILESRTPGLDLVYRANPRFKSSHRGGARLEKVRVLIVPDSEIALRLLKSGRVQALATTSRINLRSRLAAPGIKVQSRFGISWWQLFYNHSRPAVSKLEARRAFAHSFDRQGFSEAFIRSEGKALDDPAPGSDGKAAFSVYRRDAAKAKSLAKAMNEQRAVAIIPGGNQIGGILGVSLQKQLQESGIDLEIRSPDSQEFYRTWRRDGDFDIGIWELRGVPAGTLAGSYKSTAAAPFGTNYSRVKSAEIDAAVDTADGEAKPGKAREALAGLLARDLASLPLMETKVYLGYSETVSGPEPNATADGPLWNLEAWKNPPRRPL